jgi:Flp pilus assembly secretin CpaC
MKRTLAVLALIGFSLFAASAPTFAQDEPKRVDRRVLRGMHDQLKFDKDVSRTAVGDQKTLTAEVLNSRTILMLGREIGRTSLIVWFSDDSMQSFDITVQPDLGLLQRALQDIHPAITVELAPDRPAVVLRGTVPDVVYARSAESAASAYLQSERTEVPPDVAAPSGQPGGAAPSSRPQEAGRRESAVINLIRVDKLPAPLEDRISQSILSIGAADVTVSRLARNDVPDDSKDVFLLNGKVKDQVTLVRVLQLAATMVGSVELSATNQEVRVLADEAGGLTEESSTQRGQSSNNSSRMSSFGGTSSGDASSSELSNDIESNPGRAKSVSIAGGRVLSFIQVTDIPQVRVDVRLYEVNRTALLEYSPEITIIGSDFTQPSLRPPTGAVNLQGAQAVRAGGTDTQDVQGVLSFLTGGALGEFQYAGTHVAIGGVMQILETRGIARALSNPSLTVLSGEHAHFQVGGDVPIPEAFAPAYGTATTAATPGVFSSVEFRRFGVELEMRPLVGDDGRITVDIFSKVDEPDAELTTLIRDATGTDPTTTAFRSRAIETTARLADGQALMIGGLIGRRSGDDTSFTPILERVPILGWLFKRYNISDDDRELVVVVNPTVVRDPIEDLGMWKFPDVSPLSRGWVDRVIQFAQKEWPQSKGDGCVK